MRSFDEFTLPAEASSGFPQQSFMTPTSSEKKHGYCAVSSPPPRLIHKRLTTEEFRIDYPSNDLNLQRLRFPLLTADSSIAHRFRLRIRPRPKDSSETIDYLNFNSVDVSSTATNEKQDHNDILSIHRRTRKECLFLPISTDSLTLQFHSTQSTKNVVSL